MGIPYQGANYWNVRSLPNYQRVIKAPTAADMAVKLFIELFQYIRLS